MFVAAQAMATFPFDDAAAPVGDGDGDPQEAQPATAPEPAVGGATVPPIDRGNGRPAGARDDGPRNAASGGRKAAAANAADVEPVEPGVVSVPASAEPAPSTESPLRGRALTTALYEWVQLEWGTDFIKLPGCENLWKLATKRFPGSRVTQKHARELRKEYATEESKRGGAPTHIGNRGD
jgi:hypothetical protein